MVDSTGSFITAALYNFTLQVGFKVVTFTLNAVLLRILSGDIIGVANVRLMLLYTTCCFLAREPFRRSCLKQDDDGEEDQNDKTGPDYKGDGRRPQWTKTEWTKRVNCLWLCPIVSFMVSSTLALVWIYWLTPPDPTRVPHYTESVCVFTVSIVVESVGEPFWILGQQFKRVKNKAKIEACQLFVRNIITGGLILAFPSLQLRAFSIAMFVSALTYLWMYLRAFSGRRAQLARDEGGDRDSSPEPSPKHSYGQSQRFRSDVKWWDVSPWPDTKIGLDWECLELTASFWTHSLLKQFLTEGERILMTAFNMLSFTDQGVYDVIHNLGSIVVRIVFTPLEESGHTFFSLNIKRGLTAREQDPKKLEIATRVLSFLMKLTMLMGLLIIIFGFSYSPVALLLYGGQKLAAGNGPTLLRLYCGYVMLLALNGVSECFLFSFMPKSKISQHKLFMVFTCVVFLVLVWLTSSLGPSGFIIANSVNMTLRIMFSLVNIVQFYGNRVNEGGDETAVVGDGERRYRRTPINPLQWLMPSFQILLTLLISGYMTFITHTIFCCDGFFNILAHITFGGFSFLASLAVIYGTEKELVDFIEEFITKRKVKTK